jgi:tetratricopeptide (TPR) repeat protein
MTPRVSCGGPWIEDTIDPTGALVNESGAREAQPPELTRFEVVRRLGRGGMGIVYEAIDRERGARVALKTLPAFEADTLLRLKQEFRAVQDIQHPNLVTLGELMREGDTWFFTMELVDGVDLVTYVRGARAPVEDHSQEMTVPHAVRAPPRTEPQPPEPARFDEAKLRSAMTALASALQALHAAGKIHRDVKPSNVLVSREGRVVLLDFGVVSDAAMPQREEGIVGSVRYMAPEQAASEPIGPAADWYAFGVVLFECLTGRRPFDGPDALVLQAKLSEVPVPAALIAPGVPPDLEALCAELLAGEPAARPHGADVIRRIASKTASARPARCSVPPPSAGGVPFVGRDAELAVLTDAFERVRRGQTVTVVVEGESGVGKSSLVRELAADVALARQGVLVLAGRCYEREEVPYKALDGVMDAMSQHFSMRSDADVVEILPGNAWLLAQVFPVLRKLARFDVAARHSRPRADVQESRASMFATVRELFTKLGEKHVVVVTIDDLHWADTDSLALLTELLRPPLPPRLLLLATARPGEGTLREGAPFALPGDVTKLTLGRLSAVHAVELANLLLEGESESTGRLAAAIAAESAGHPLFVDELVRHARELGGRAPTKLHLDDALAARVARLAPTERALIEVLAVAGVSLPQDAAMHAAGLDFDGFSRAASALRAAHLARSGGPHGADAIEPYHDRVRESVVARLDEPTRRKHHEGLALALEARADADPEALTTHWLEAGQPASASVHARAAADKAFDALAYDRAVSLYERALELVDDEDVRRPMRLRLGEALASAGRSAQAAAAFLRAAEHATTAPQEIDLRRRAAEELLIAGKIDAGTVALADVLSRIGMWMPPSRLWTLVMFVTFRLLLRLRGLKHQLCDEAQIPRQALLRLDACWGVARTLSVTDPMKGSYFQTRMLLLALRHGEPYRLVYALGLEGAYRAVRGVRARVAAEEVIEKAEELARGIEGTHARAVPVGMRGFAAFVQGRFREAVELSDRAVAMIGEHAPGMFWDIRAAQMNALWALSFMGELKAVAARIERTVREAEARGDLAATTTYRTGSFTPVWLRTGEPAVARAHVQRVMEQWTHRHYHNQHYWGASALSQIDLYEGKGTDAHERLSREYPRAERAFTFRMEILHVGARHLRARSAILAAREASPSDREPLLRIAERDAHWLGGAPPSYSHPWGSLVRACALAVRGDDVAAALALERAVHGFDATGLALFAAAARWRLGQLRGGDDGIALRSTAEAWMKDQEIAEPARMVAMIAPGFRE